jgi:hypothetical protein
MWPHDREAEFKKNLPSKAAAIAKTLGDKWLAGERDDTVILQHADGGAFCISLSIQDWGWQYAAPRLILECVNPDGTEGPSITVHGQSGPHRVAREIFRRLFRMLWFPETLQMSDLLARIEPTVHELERLVDQET